MAEYKCLSRFCGNLYDTIATSFPKQILRIDAAYVAFDKAADTIRQCYEDPSTTTKISLEALHIECLAHLDRYAALVAEYKAALEAFDVDALTNIVAMTPEGVAMGIGEIKTSIETHVQEYS
jgi:hypothetical protein